MLERKPRPGTAVGAAAERSLSAFVVRQAGRRPSELKRRLHTVRAGAGARLGRAPERSWGRVLGRPSRASLGHGVSLRSGEGGRSPGPAACRPHAGAPCGRQGLAASASPCGAPVRARGEALSPVAGPGAARRRDPACSAGRTPRPHVRDHPPRLLLNSGCFCDRGDQVRWANVSAGRGAGLARRQANGLWTCVTCFAFA